jgi:hypothetical protein
MKPSLVASVLLVVLAASTSNARAGETRGRSTQPASPESELVLPAGAISAAVEPWVPDVRRCWLKHASRRARADGNLRIEVIIDPVGMVWRHSVVAAGPRSRPLERCLDTVVEQWRFPMRRGYTPAAIPFLFRASPGRQAGPFPTCFSPRGCSRRPPRPTLNP